MGKYFIPLITALITIAVFWGILKLMIGSESCNPIWLIYLSAIGGGMVVWSYIYFLFIKGNKEGYEHKRDKH